jgi:hypothetical protein
MTSVKAVDYDNRGTREHPFGYVYFNDGTRLGFAPSAKVRDPHPLAGKFNLFITNWGGLTGSHFKAAEKLLETKL